MWPRRVSPVEGQVVALAAALLIANASTIENLDSAARLMRAERHSLAPATPRADTLERPVQVKEGGTSEAHLADNEKIKNACWLEVCIFHNRSSPRLFVAEHNDGMGHRMQNVLDGMAIAVKNGMNFGGVIPLKAGPRAKMRNVTDLFFGKNASLAMFHEVSMDEKFNDRNTMEKKRSQFKDYANIFLPSTDMWQLNNKAKSAEYYTPALKASLRRLLDKRPLKFSAKGKPTVAIHLRRGDLRASEGRSMKDGYFFRVADDVRKLLPEADFHVWSSIENWNDEMEQFGTKYWKSSDYDGYRQRHMTVHLDNNEDEDMLSAWAHLARADVMLMSRSSFSYVPAALNNGCVIHPGMWPAMEDWVNGEDEKRKNYSQDLEACIDRALPGRRRDKKL